MIFLLFFSSSLMVLFKNLEFTIFDGGSVIEFTTAPTINDNVVIFFYRGSIGQDSFLFDVNEVIKVGDTSS